MLRKNGNNQIDKYEAKLELYALGFSTKDCEIIVSSPAFPENYFVIKKNDEFIPDLIKSFGFEEIATIASLGSKQLKAFFKYAQDLSSLYEVKDILTLLKLKGGDQNLETLANLNTALNRDWLLEPKEIVQIFNLHPEIESYSFLKIMVGQRDALKSMGFVKEIMMALIKSVTHSEDILAIANHSSVIKKLELNISDILLLASKFPDLTSLLKLITTFKLSAKQFFDILNAYPNAYQLLCVLEEKNKSFSLELNDQKVINLLRNYNTIENLSDLTIERIVLNNLNFTLEQTNSVLSKIEIKKHLSTLQMMMHNFQLTPDTICEILNTKHYSVETLPILLKALPNLISILKFTNQNLLALINTCQNLDELISLSSQAAGLKQLSDNEIITLVQKINIQKDLSTLIKIFRIIDKNIVLSLLENENNKKILYQMLLPLIEYQNRTPITSSEKKLTLPDIEFLSPPVVQSVTNQNTAVPNTAMEIDAPSSDVIVPIQTNSEFFAAPEINNDEDHFSPAQNIQYPTTPASPPFRIPTMQDVPSVSKFKSLDLISVQNLKKTAKPRAQNTTNYQKLISLGFVFEEAILLIQKQELPKLIEQIDPFYETLIQEFEPAKTVLAPVAKVGIENIIALAKYFETLRLNFETKEILDIASDIEGKDCLETIANKYPKLKEIRINGKQISKNQIFRIMRRNWKKNIDALLRNQDKLSTYKFELEQIVSILEKPNGAFNLVTAINHYPDLKEIIRSPAEMAQLALRTEAYKFINLAFKLLPVLTKIQINYSLVFEILMTRETPEIAYRAIFELAKHEETIQMNKRKEMEQPITSMRTTPDPSIVMSEQGDPKRRKTLDYSVNSTSVTQELTNPFTLSINPPPPEEEQNEPTSNDEVVDKLINLGFAYDQAKQLVKENIETINKYILPHYENLIKEFAPAQITLMHVASIGLKEFGGFVFFHQRFLKVYQFEHEEIISIANNKHSQMTFQYLNKNYNSLSNITIQNEKITNAELTLIASHDEGFRHLNALEECHKFLALKNFRLQHVVKLLDHHNAFQTMQTLIKYFSELEKFFNPEQILIIAGRLEGDQNILAALKAANLNYPVDAIVNNFMINEDSQFARDCIEIWIEQSRKIQSTASSSTSTSNYAFFQNQPYEEHAKTAQSNDSEFVNLNLLDEQELFESFKTTALSMSKKNN